MTSNSVVMEVDGRSNDVFDHLNLHGRARFTSSHVDPVYQPKCPHYNRNCIIKSPCCGEWTGCRLCHDEVHDHTLNRHEIKAVMCGTCSYEQEPAQYCVNCNACLGEYFCSICNLFDHDGGSKGIFHCNECGICRVGGRDQYFHCHTCDSCYHNDLKDNHVCVQKSMHQDCPVCLEYLFSSRDATQVLGCGHVLHRSCLTDLLGTRNECPICRKGIVDMTEHFDRLRRLIAATPMPDEYSGKEVNILCNDCQCKGTVSLHFMGLECENCHSFNTSIV